MLSEGEGRDADLKGFLRYASAVSEHIPFGDKGTRNWVPPPFAYALMGDFNRELLKPEVEIKDNQIIRIQSISLARLRHEMIRETRWLGTDAQFTAMIRRFEERGFLSVHHNEITMTQDLLMLLVEHARTAYTSLLGVPATLEWNPTAKDWLHLNKTIFELLHRDFGKLWRIVRAKINTAIAAHRKNKNNYDHVGGNTTYWVVINLVGFLVDMPESDIDREIRLLNLRKLAGPMDDILPVIRELIAAGVIVRDGVSLRLASHLVPDMVNYERETVKGMHELRTACERWGLDQQPKTY